MIFYYLLLPLYLILLPRNTHIFCHIIFVLFIFPSKFLIIIMCLIILVVYFIIKYIFMLIPGDKFTINVSDTFNTIHHEPQ